MRVSIPGKIEGKNRLYSPRTNERAENRLDLDERRTKGRGRRRLVKVLWSSAFYRARRVDEGVGRSNGPRDHSDDREDGLGPLGGHNSDAARASRMRTGGCHHCTGGFCLPGALANLLAAVCSPINPRVAGMVSKKDDAHGHRPMDGHTASFHQNGRVRRSRGAHFVPELSDSKINVSIPTVRG